MRKGTMSQGTVVPQDAVGVPYLIGPVCSSPGKTSSGISTQMECSSKSKDRGYLFSTNTPFENMSTSSAQDVLPPGDGGVSFLDGCLAQFQSTAVLALNHSLSPEPSGRPKAAGRVKASSFAARQRSSFAAPLAQSGSFRFDERFGGFAMKCDVVGGLACEQRCVVERGAQRPAVVVGVRGLARSIDLDVLGTGRFDQGFDVLDVGREDRDGTVAVAAAVLGDRDDLGVHAGDLLAEEEALSLAQHEQPGRQCRRLDLARLPHQDDVEFDPVGAAAVQQPALVVEYRTADGIGPADELAFLPRRDYVYFIGRASGRPARARGRG